MPKIVVTNNQGFTEKQKERLSSLGDVVYYDSFPENPNEYLERVKGADIICSGTAGLKDAYQKLKDVYVTVAFVSVAFIKEFDVLKDNNVILSNAPGANRYAVSEWIMAMILLLMRDLPNLINSKKILRINGVGSLTTSGLAGNNITILGKGNVGNKVGELATAFGMSVRYFTRGDNLFDSVRDAVVVVDTLSSNSTTLGLLDVEFFDAMKQDSYFVSITRSEITNEDALLTALNEGKLAGAALDFGGILVGDTEDRAYQKFLNHPKVIVTPHISYNSEMSRLMGCDIMIDNVEAYINGTPQNVVSLP